MYVKMRPHLCTVRRQFSPNDKKTKTKKTKPKKPQKQKTIRSSLLFFLHRRTCFQSEYGFVLRENKNTHILETRQMA